MALDDIMDVPAKVLEFVVDTLKGVGIELPPFLIQLFLLVLVLILLFLLIRQLRTEMKPLKVLESVGLGLIAFGIVFSWIEQAVRPLPEEINGRIEIVGRSERNLYVDMRVNLLDFRDQLISRGTGYVDTTDGRFALAYDRGFGVRPRKIVVTAPGCKDKEHTISRFELRSGNPISLQFDCEGHS